MAAGSSGAGSAASLPAHGWRVLDGGGRRFEVLQPGRIVLHRLPRMRPEHLPPQLHRVASRDP